MHKNYITMDGAGALRGPKRGARRRGNSGESTSTDAFEKSIIIGEQRNDVDFNLTTCLAHLH